MRAVEARLEGARASFVNATSEWERQSSLYKTSDVSRSSMEDSEVNLRRVESDLRAQEQNVEVARAEVDRAEQAVAYATLAAPMTGRITKLNSEVGETVTGSIQNFGTVIMEIADLSEMLVKAEIDETDVAPVRAGQSARVFINAFPDEVFEGTVETIALQHSFGRDQSKFFATEVLLHLDPEHNIYSGLTANVDVEVETLEGVLKVPSQAVLDKRVDELPAEISGSAEIDKNKTFARVVYVLKDGKAVETPVRIGPSDLTQTAVLAGISDGDEVIIGPWKILQELEHNKAVRRREPEKTEAPAVAEGEAAPAESADSAETTDEKKKDEKSSDATKADAETDGDASS
jgi:HlyD family secretion protein